MKIITGYRGEPHITSQQDRNVNIGIFGSGTHIVNVGSKMAATIVSANEITIADGLLVAEGCTAEIERGTTESISIENGAQEMLRKDLIVARYTKTSGTGVEDMQLAYIAGTPAASAPALPAYNTGTIASGDTLVDFPLYTVNLNGISIESVERMVDYVELANKTTVDALSTKIGSGTLSTTAKNLIGAVNELLTKIGTGTLATTTKNVVGAINELLGKINTANSNITAVTNRVSSLETKTGGISGTLLLSVPNGETNYRRLNAVATYLVIVSTVAGVDEMKGLYIVGVQSNNSIGIKVVSNASSVSLFDQGNLLLGIRNNGVSYIRVNIITLYGTAL